jgi:hypothetical protein
MHGDQSTLLTLELGGDHAAASPIAAALDPAPRPCAYTRSSSMGDDSRVFVGDFTRKEFRERMQAGIVKVIGRPALRVVYCTASNPRSSLPCCSLSLTHHPAAVTCRRLSSQ